jgi:hypothetical protein
MDGQAGVVNWWRLGDDSLGVVVWYGDHEEWLLPSDEVEHHNYDRRIRMDDTNFRFHIRIHRTALQALYDVVEE